MKLELSTYTPVVVATDTPMVPNIVLVALPVYGCPCCSSPMVMLPKQASLPEQVSIAGQLERGKLHIASGYNDEHFRQICTVCAEAGKAQVTCVICGELRPTNQIEERVGEPPDFICTLCYATVPAKAYDAVLQRLQEAHQYDYE